MEAVTMSDLCVAFLIMYVYLVLIWILSHDD